MDRVQWIKITLIAMLSLITLFIPFGTLGVPVNPVEQRVIALFVMAALLWILEPVPIWATSVLVIVLMLFTISDKAPVPLQIGDDGNVFSNLLSYKAIMATFAEPTIMLFLGGFFLAAAATKYQLDVNLARVLLKPFGKNPKYVLLGLLMVTSLFSMFMSNTATAAMMLAILAPVLALFDINDKGRIAFALAIPIGANLGGMGTPIGTPPNAIAMKVMNEIPGLAPISFGKWMAFAVPYMVVMVLFAWFILIKFFPSEKKSLELKLGDKFLSTPKAIIVYVTFGLTVILWMIGDFLHLDSNTIAMIPMAVFSVTQVITVKDINKMSWDVLWLVAGGFALGLGLQKTGLAVHLLQAIPFASWPGFAVLVGASLIGLFMSTFMSNTAAASLLVPIVAALGISMGSSLDVIGGVYGVIIGVALSCSLAMSLPISTPPNALAYSTGLVKTKDMAKMGITLGLVGIVIVFGMMLILSHFGFFAFLAQ
ncbi:MAG: dihydroorotate dehydrogenase [Fibrobacteres bacterium CG2_30_45_31]|nr:MAG: dihydroorotate dehydrogenase [Fibrobacteres bacterium CG2_30_45_31]